MPGPWHTTETDPKRFRPVIDGDASICPPSTLARTEPQHEPPPEPGRAYGFGAAGEIPLPPEPER